MNKKLYVGNLSYNTMGSQLETMFAEAGEVVEAVVIEDRDTGRSKGFGFVEMADEDAATKAVQLFNGKEVDGRALNVAEAKPRQRRDDRGYSGSRW
jgi:RNA recognition motif-containing protein